MTWPCFMVYPTDREARYLRRTADGECPGKYKKWHSASVQVEDGPFTKSFQIEGTDSFYHGRPPASDYADDLRWPAKCDYCPFVFEVADPGFTSDGWLSWHVDTDAYFRADDGREWVQRELPAGAMYESPWHRSFGVGPDGRSLSVILPPGGIYEAWHVDGTSTSGGRWSRTGVPPGLTVKPSIKSPHYHGHLTNGVLTDCLGDRKVELARATAEWETR